MKALWDIGESGFSAGVCISATGNTAQMFLNHSPDKRDVKIASGEYVASPHRSVGEGGSTNPAVSLYFYHLDHLGTPRVITDVNGNVITYPNGSVSKFKYLPFGEELSPPDSTNTHEFTGHERDAETGLDYMLARYYGSDLGRLLSPDPIGGSVGDPQSWNRYAYVGNNPIAFIDPLGLYKVTGDSADEFNQQTEDAIGFDIEADENGDMQRPEGPATAENQVAVDAFDAAANADFTINADSGSDVAIDNYDTQTVNPGQIGALPSSAPASSPQSVTQGEVVTHILAEYTAGSASGFAKGSFPSAHERGLEAQNQYRAGQGQAAVTSTTVSLTKNVLFSPLTGNFRTIDFNRADGGRTRVTIQKAGWFTPAGVTVE